jgi:hypothetical protein
LVHDGLLPLSWLSAIFAFLAGVIWLGASRIASPRAIKSIVLTDDGFTGDIQDLTQALSRQSFWNSIAAGAAWIAAVLQIVVLYAAG